MEDEGRCAFVEAFSHRCRSSVSEVHRRAGGSDDPGFALLDVRSRPILFAVGSLERCIVPSSANAVSFLFRAVKKDSESEMQVDATRALES